MIPFIRLTFFCAALLSLCASAEDKPKPWTDERLIAKVRSLAEKLQDEYAKEKDLPDKEKDHDHDTWRALDYYADKLRSRIYTRSRNKDLSRQKTADLQWLGRESEQRSYAMRRPEPAAKALKELKILLAEIKEQLKTNDELPRGAAFQLKARIADDAMRPMQEAWNPPKGEEVDD